MKGVVLLVLTSAIFCAGAAFCASEGTIDPFSGRPCYSCHRSKTVGAYLHGALEGNACTPCHKLSNGSHQQNKTFSAVKDRTSALCYECHDNFSSGVSVHGPVAENDCLVCHAPHSSSIKYLLRASSDRLCFGCHEERDLTGESAAMKTAFRNKGENLHLLHVKKGKVACLTCHTPHRSTQAFLISDRKEKGSQSVVYRKERNGGSCATNCHDKLAYSR